MSVRVVSTRYVRPKEKKEGNEKYLGDVLLSKYRGGSSVKFRTPISLSKEQGGVSIVRFYGVSFHRSSFSPMKGLGVLNYPRRDYGGYRCKKGYPVLSHPSFPIRVGLGHGVDLVLGPWSWGLM